MTPLHTASSDGHAEVVRVLLAKGADVEASTNVSVFRAVGMLQHAKLNTDMHVRRWSRPQPVSLLR
jgi:ankyrin repeat protein